MIFRHKGVLVSEYDQFGHTFSKDITQLAGSRFVYNSLADGYSAVDLVNGGYSYYDGAGNPILNIQSSLVNILADC